MAPLDSPKLDIGTENMASGRKILTQEDYSMFEKRRQFAKVQLDYNRQREQEEDLGRLQELNREIGFERISIDNKDSTKEKAKVQLSKEEIKKKELYKQARFSELAYSEFSTVKEDGKPKGLDEMRIKNVLLDPIGFPNLKNMVSGNFRREDLSPDEKLLLKFMNTPEIILEASNPKNRRLGLEVRSDVDEILVLADLDIRPSDKPTYADSSGDKSQMSQQEKKQVSEYQERLYKRNIVSLSMELVRKDKVQENGTLLNDLQKEYGDKIKFLDYFPKGKESASSGLRAICLQDEDGSKIFAIAGTEIKSFGDFYKDFKADLSILFRMLPEKQAKDMIAFVNENIKQGEKFKVCGHSLGGTLAEALGVMYTNVTENKDTKENTYEYQATSVKTFNSPGARGLSVSNSPNIEKDNPNKSIILEKIGHFGYNNEKDGIGEKMESIRGKKGLSPIAGLGEHVANHEILLQELSSHGIADVIKYIDKDSSPEELKSKRIRYKDLEESTEPINKR